MDPLLYGQRTSGVKQFKFFIINTTGMTVAKRKERISNFQSLSVMNKGLRRYINMLLRILIFFFVFEYPPMDFSGY